MFWVISRPAISLLKLQATLCSSDRLILPPDVSAHNCRNNFEFIAVYEIVCAVEDSAQIRMKTCNLSDRAANHRNERLALNGSAPPTRCSILHSATPTYRGVKLAIGIAGHGGMCAEVRAGSCQPRHETPIHRQQQEQAPDGPSACP